MNAVTESNFLEAVHPEPGSASDLLVVAWLYNTTGLGTWCWEAAHALQELGQNVILIAAQNVQLPGIPAVEVARIGLAKTPASGRRGFATATSTVKRHLSAGPDGVLAEIDAFLKSRGVQPGTYLLNESFLVDPHIPCRQIVTAWAYPVDLLSYLRKIPLLVRDGSARSFLHTTFSIIGLWRKDWRGYRAAGSVLPVTKALLSSLHRRSIAANLAYPGTSVGPVKDRGSSEIRLLMAAVDLNEPRKRIPWMLDAMKGMQPPSGTTLQLVGNPDSSVMRAADQLGFPVEFLGHLMRQDLQEVMQNAHIFCFGSLLDDWGYVLVEAMANGLVPVAPDISPFNEILDGVGVCYNAYSQEDFVRSLNSALACGIPDRGRQAWDRAQVLFSRQAFGRAILESVEYLARRCGS
jgi:glycosyltransferase involved in cell wall biosynthesis